MTNQEVLRNYIDMVKTQTLLVRNVLGVDNTETTVEFYRYNGEDVRRIENIHPEYYLENFDFEAIEEDSAEIVIGDIIEYFSGNVDDLDTETLVAFRYKMEDGLIHDDFFITHTILKEETDITKNISLGSLGINVLLNPISHVGGTCKEINGEKYYHIVTGERPIANFFEYNQTDVDTILEDLDEEETELYDDLVERLNERNMHIHSIVFQKLIYDLVEKDKLLVSFEDPEDYLELTYETLEDEELESQRTSFYLAEDGKIMVETDGGRYYVGNV